MVSAQKASGETRTYFSKESKVLEWLNVLNKVLSYLGNVMDFGGHIGASLVLNANSLPTFDVCHFLLYMLSMMMVRV